MRLLLIIGLGQLMCSASPAQDMRPPSFETVRDLFVDSGSGDGIPAEWIACNNDSSYYLNDTLFLYDNFSWSMSSGCCQFIRWMPGGNFKLDIAGLDICAVSAPTNVTFENLYLQFKLKQKGSRTMLIVRQKGKVPDEFEAIDLSTISLNEYEEQTQRLVLRRVKN